MRAVLATAAAASGALMSCGLAGCAALPLAALGTVVGVAASAVGTGAEVYSLGKLDTAERASYAQARAAVDAAADELRLTPIDDRYEKGARIIRLRDDRDAAVEVTIAPRTLTLVRLRINVGLFGSEPTARLLLQKIRERLPDATTPRETPGAAGIAS